jgi:RNA polymerase sigma factor (TIGR02999 family)
MAQEKPGQSLDPTGLVHEAYLRLVDTANQQEFANRRHFFAAAAEAMRRILVESARRKKRHKRGGNRRKVELTQAIQPLVMDGDVLAVDEALHDFAKHDAEGAELVKLHFFAGLTIDEAARLLGISSRTAYRNWAFARAWLYEHLRDGDTGP